MLSRRKHGTRQQKEHGRTCTRTRTGLLRCVHAHTGKLDLLRGVHAHTGKLDLLRGVHADLLRGVHADLLRGVHADLLRGVHADLLRGAGQAGLAPQRSRPWHKDHFV